MDAVYVQGESARYEIVDAGYTDVALNYGTTYVTLTLSNGKWGATINTRNMDGRYLFACIADGHAVETGAFYVRPLVSKYRAVMDAIDAALQANAANGKYSVTVGELSLQDKTFDEMVKFRNYYARLADADENGVAPSFGPRRVSEVYES